MENYGPKSRGVKSHGIVFTGYSFAFFAIKVVVQTVAAANNGNYMLYLSRRYRFSSCWVLSQPSIYEEERLKENFLLRSFFNIIKRGNS